MEFLKKMIKKSFNSIGYQLVNQAAFHRDDSERVALKVALNRLVFLITQAGSNFNQTEIQDLLNFSGDKLLQSKAQLFQDLFVLYTLKNKRNGFFIEFGATDGVSLSNTHLLEKKYGWTGILAEPGKVWRQKLKENRNCFIDNRCVWTKSGEVLTFHETDIAELSTINDYEDADFFAEKRKDNKAYKVDTISLNDLILFYNAPSIIDYLSIDTEGSEFDILNAFDFSKYDVRIITVEHNYAGRRDDIFKLLTANGYRRVFESISLFDDWYIKEPIRN